MANRGPVIQRRIAGFISILLLLILLLTGRIAWIQFVQGHNLSAKAQTQLQENRGLQSPRGTIFDRNGRELAISSMTKSLYVNPSELNRDPETLAALLAPLLEMPPAELQKSLSANGQFVWLKRMLEADVSAKVESLIKEQDIKGLAFVEESKRYYPNDTLASQVLGFVGTDDVGLDGLEMALDATIKGKLSEQVVDTDSRGIPIFKSVFTFAPPKQGKNVYLTLDSTIQFIVEQSLDRAMAQTRSSGATVIVMNPRTGDILAMANRPTFDPNHFYRYSSQDWKNRAVSNIYEPGSTFKSVVAAAALQEGVVYPEERFMDKGFVEVSGRKIQNWSGESYGNISFIDIIKESINTGFVQVGMRLGASRLTNYARAFGFGQATGIELPGEEDGLLFKPEKMRDSDLATMSIGQSIAVTPLQLITAVAAIANDGVLLKPHIIKEIQNADGSVYSATVSEPVRQAITPETAQRLKGLLEKVVSEGGGAKAAVKGYRIAGKTGTAQKAQENGGYYAGRYIASFVGFAPVEDPQMVVLVVLDDPSGVYYGGQIAAPVAHEIFAQVLRYLNIYPQASNVPPKALGQKQRVTTAGANTPLAPPQGKAVVPYVVGRSLRDAGELLTKAGLAMAPEGTGLAVEQSISANTIVDAGSEIRVYFEPR
ncbi:MAG: penicillin-binding transpeptidase domain-containing protein [Veillonellales bacterium]